MILKKYLFIAVICAFLTGQTAKGMEAWALDTQDKKTSMAQERNIIVECVDENEKQLFTVELPHSAVSLSKTLTNALGDSDENADTITISTSLCDFSPWALQIMLSLIKDFSQNPSAMIFINLLSHHNKLTNNDLLQLVNASSYLSCETLHNYLITTLMMRIRSSINDIPSLKQALEFAQILENTDHTEHLLSYAPLRNQITYFIKNKNTLNDHNKRISALCYSPDGKILATASWDQTIKIWDTTTNTCIKTLTGHEGNIISLNISPDGTKLISTCDEQSVKIWDIEKEECLQTIEINESIPSATFSPLDNNLIAVATYNYLTIYPNYLEDIKYEINGHSDEISKVVFSPQGDYIASSDDRTIKLWNTKDYTCEHTFEGHEFSITEICFSPDGTKLISGDVDGIIKIWNISSKECLTSFNSHGLSVNALCFAPNNEVFASGGDDDLIKLWNASSGECINNLRTNSNIRALSFAPNGLQLAAGLHNNTIDLYSFHDIKKEFSLGTLLLAEYLMINKGLQLPSDQLYFDLFTQLPITFQNYFAAQINQDALKAYQDNKQ